MTQVVRGVAVFGATLAAYYSLRLLLAFVHSPRHQIASHVLWMNTALLITAGVIVARMVLVWGGRPALSAWDLAIAVQVICLVAGLRPVWRHHNKARLRRTP